MQTTAEKFDTLPGYRRRHAGATVQIPATTVAECTALWASLQRVEAEINGSESVAHAEIAAAE